MKTTYGFLAFLLSATSIANAQQADPSNLSMVAGYKAAFTCSAHFNAGRSVEQIAGDELHRILPTFGEAMPEMPDAIIDEENKRVSVKFSDAFPPRIAQWRPHLGCVQLPNGTSEDFADDVPYAKVKMTRDLVRPLAEDLSDDATLATVIDAAFDRNTYGDGNETTATLILKDGVIIAEQYRDGFDQNTSQRTWSVAKSIAASVIGAAVEKGHIDVDDPAGLATWSSDGDPRADITLENLLNMASGLDNGPAGNRTDHIYFGGGRVIDHAATRRLIVEPGTRWYYANNDTMLAMRALRERMNDDKEFLAFPFEALLHRIGMRNTYLETDWNGDFILSSQVWTTARDLARLGTLYLNDGVWEGKRILPAGWGEYVSQPAKAQPGPRANGDPNPGYGAQWWLYDENWGLPNGTYAARGNRGQFLMIIPERNILIIRRGFDSNQPGGGRFDLPAFARDVLATLPE